MQIKLPRLCQGCSAEFLIEDAKELGKADDDGRRWMVCPICDTKNLVYSPARDYDTSVR